MIFATKYKSPLDFSSRREKVSAISPRPRAGSQAEKRGHSTFLTAWPVRSLVRSSYLLRLPKKVTTWPRSTATKRWKFKSSAGCVIVVFREFVAIIKQAEV